MFLSKQLKESLLSLLRTVDHHCTNTIIAIRNNKEVSLEGLDVAIHKLQQVRNELALRQKKAAG